MDKIIRWGVIGAGGIARRRTIPEGIMKAGGTKLVSVYDTNPEVNREVAAESGATACGSMESLLESGIDAVYVASPAYAHAGHVEACARAGKHVLCEKPLGMSVEEAGSMMRACRDAGVKLGTGLMMRFHAQHRAALEMVREGKLGKLVYGRAQLSCWYPPIEGAWRQQPGLSGGGSLMDMGGHCIDLMEMYFGKIKKVCCFTANNIHPYPSEDSAVALFTFEGGAMATVDAYFCIPDNSSKNMLEIYGSRGSIIARGTIGQGAEGEMAAYLEGDGAGYDAAQQRSADNSIAVIPPPVNTYLAQVEEFNAAIREEREPANGGMAGYTSQLVLAACYESAKTGKVVDIDYP